jgi:predicted DNA-binding transcriptional regulator AlpA
VYSQVAHVGGSFGWLRISHPRSYPHLVSHVSDARPKFSSEGAPTFNVDVKVEGACLRFHVPGQRLPVSNGLTYEQAAIILGCHPSNVPKLIRKGHLTSNGAHGPGARSLSLAEVEALAERRRRPTLVTKQSRPLPRRADPRPDADHEWLSVPQVAQLLGVTRPAVASRIKRERLPATESHGRWWVRRDLLEQVEGARLVRKTRRP